MAMSPKKVAKVGIKAVMKHRHTDLKEAQKWAIVAFCMVGFTDKIAHGRVEAAAKHFGMHKDTVRGVVREYRNEVDAGAVFPDIAPKSRENTACSAGRMT